MGTDNFAKKIDLVVMTGSVPFITAGIIQSDSSDATLISGALTGMSNLFKELLQKGELRHSELFNAHIYIRYLNQINDYQGLISSEIKHGAQMRVALIVKEGELSREQELALSELSYSIMIKICERSNFAKKLINGNIEGYIATPLETIEILTEAINDYRRRAKKSIFYENLNFLQGKNKFISLPYDDNLLENLIQQFHSWIEEKCYPDFFPKLPFRSFFGKLDYWAGVSELKKTFYTNYSQTAFKEKVSLALLQFILQSGFLPLVHYSGDVLTRIENFYIKELPIAFDKFINNLLIIRGPVGIGLQCIKKKIESLKGSNRFLGWRFLHFFLNNIGERPFEIPFLKQFCKIIEQFSLEKEFLIVLNQIKLDAVPQEYVSTFIQIINSNLAKPLLADELKSIKEDSGKTIKKLKGAPTAPKFAECVKNEIVQDQISIEITKIDITLEENLPKPSPESSLIRDQLMIQTISDLFSWVHDFLFGKIIVNKKNLPTITTEGLFFYNISESLTIEIGLILDLIQSFADPRTWLIGQLERILNAVEEKLKNFDPEKIGSYKQERKLIFDVQHVEESFRRIAEKIITIITQIETDAVKEKISKENKKSYLESGFLGRIQEISIPQTRKHLEELKSINKNLSNKELKEIYNATNVDLKDLISNLTSTQFLAIPFPVKDSDYPKKIREIISEFRNWDLELDKVINTIFRVAIEIQDPLKMGMHENIFSQFLRAQLHESINKKLSALPNSDWERKKLVLSSFLFKKELFSLVGNCLLNNKPLKLFTTIPLAKDSAEKNFIFSFSPIKPPTISDEIKRFFIVPEGLNEIIGRIYPYQPFNNEEINNLTELIVSDAFRRAYATIEEDLLLIIKIGKKMHSGITNLQDQLIETYNLICSQLTIIKNQPIS